MEQYWGVFGTGGTVTPGPQFNTNAAALTSADFGDIPADTMPATIDTFRDGVVSSLADPGKNCPWGTRGVVFCNVERPVPPYVWVPGDTSAEALAGAEAIADGVHVCRPLREAWLYLASYPGFFNSVAEIDNRPGRVVNRANIKAYAGVIRAYNAVSPEVYLYDRNEASARLFIESVIVESVRVAGSIDRVAPVLSPRFLSDVSDPLLVGEMYGVPLWRMLVGALVGLGVKKVWIFGYHTTAPEAADYQIFSDTYGGS